MTSQYARCMMATWDEHDDLMSTGCSLLRNREYPSCDGHLAAVRWKSGAGRGARRGSTGSNSGEYEVRLLVVEDGRSVAEALRRGLTFDSFANVVASAILRLRKAVDEGNEKPLIQTVRGVGYRIRA